MPVHCRAAQGRPGKIEKGVSRSFSTVLLGINAIWNPVGEMNVVAATKMGICRVGSSRYSLMGKERCLERNESSWRFGKGGERGKGMVKGSGKRKKAQKQ